MRKLITKIVLAAAMVATFAGALITSPFNVKADPGEYEELITTTTEDEDRWKLGEYDYKISTKSVKATTKGYYSQAKINKDVLSKASKKKVNIISINQEVGDMLKLFLKKNPKYKNKYNYILVNSGSVDDTYYNVMIKMLKSKKYKVIVVTDYSLLAPYVMKDDNSSLTMTKYKNADRDKLLNAMAPMSKFGITKKSYANAYSYTKKIGSTKKGTLKATSFYVCPASFAIKKDVAQEVLGTTDTDKINEMFSTWDGFMEVAKKAKEKGYYMTSDLTFFSYFYETSKNPANVEAIYHKMFSNDYSKRYYAWSIEWSADMYKSDVFCYFSTTWFEQYCIDTDVDYLVVGVPEATFWGGTYIGGNAAAAKDPAARAFVKAISCGSSTMTEYCKSVQYIPNNTKTVSKLCKSGTNIFTRNKFIKNNALKYYDKTAKKITIK